MPLDAARDALITLQWRVIEALAGENARLAARVTETEATRNRYAIRGYISTAAKHDAGILTALRDALAGSPWMPPIPAQA